MVRCWLKRIVIAIRRRSHATHEATTASLSIHYSSLPLAQMPIPFFFYLLSDFCLLLSVYFSLVLCSLGLLHPCKKYCKTNLDNRIIHKYELNRTSSTHTHCLMSRLRRQMHSGSITQSNLQIQVTNKPCMSLKSLQIILQDKDSSIFFCSST